MDGVTPNIRRIKADRVWQESRGTGVRIGVLDTGVDPNQPALEENVKTCYDVIRGVVGGGDLAGHGTFVAGIIAANNKGRVKAGVAPEANLYCVKVSNDEGRIKPSALIAGIAWCIENRMQVVNMSLGFTSNHLAIHDAMRKAADSGIFLVAAAGNDGHGSGKVRFPAAYEFVVAVTATEQSGLVARRSSRGPEVDLCAPGDWIISTARYSHLPESEKSLAPEGRFIYWPERGAWTSFAAPHVTGVAALVLAVNSSLGSTGVRQLLKETAEDLRLPASEQGAGMVDARAATEGALRGRPAEP